MSQATPPKPSPLSGIERVGKWIYAREVDRRLERKTNVWIICADDGEVELGAVRWLGKWRCYVYFPLNDTIYEKQCLHDIANFCASKTNAHRARNPLVRKEVGKAHRAERSNDDHWNYEPDDNHAKVNSGR